MSRLASDEVEAILARFEQDWAALLVVQVDNFSIRHAAALARRFGLRGYDSVHLAAAERLAATSSVAELRFASFEAALNKAAVGLGLQLLEPIAESS